MEAQVDKRYIHRHGSKWRVEKRVDGSFVKVAFDTLEEAIAYRDELLSRLQRGRGLQRAVVSGHATVGELVDLWFNGPPGDPSVGFKNRRAKPPSPTTVVDFQRRIDRHISLIAHHDIGELRLDPLILDVFLHETLTPGMHARLLPS